MGTQIPKEVYAYVVSYLGTVGQVIPTVPPLTATVNNFGNYLIKIKDDNPSTAIMYMSLGVLLAPDMIPTKIVCTSDAVNKYVYVGGSNPLSGGIYKVINDASANPVPYILPANTNGIFDVDEANKKLYFANAAGTTVTIKDMSVVPLPDISFATVYATITEIKISPDGTKLLVAGTALIGTALTPIIDVYTKDTLGAWQLANRVTYVPNGITPTNVVVEIAVNKASTIAYAVNPNGGIVSSILLTGTFVKTDALLSGYTPNSVQLKGTELYVADSSGPRILILDAISLSTLKIITPAYPPYVVPYRLALTAYEDALYVSPAVSTDTIGLIPQWRIEVVDPVTGINAEKGTFNVGLYSDTEVVGVSAPSPIATFTILSTNDISPSVPIPDDRLQDLNEAVCIITTKVFSSCKDKDCLADVTTDPLLGTAPYVLGDITFGKAVISNETIAYINDGKNLSRVQFDVTAPYIITYTANGLPETAVGTLNLGHKDMLMYIPQTANKNVEDYKLIAETYTEVLDGPKVVNNRFVFTVGVYEIFKIAEDVQLFIPTFGYCPVPEDYIAYTPLQPIGICDAFLNDTSFPEDFFPFQYEHFQI